jgi:hypothetical protein
MKTLVIKFSPTPSYFFSLLLKLSQHPVLTHPQSIFFAFGFHFEITLIPYSFIEVYYN